MKHKKERIELVMYKHGEVVAILNITNMADIEVIKIAKAQREIFCRRCQVKRVFIDEEVV